VELGGYYKAAEHVKMFIDVTYLHSGNCIFTKCYSTVFPCREFRTELYFCAFFVFSNGVFSMIWDKGSGFEK
jgi:hypothetical protein